MSDWEDDDFGGFESADIGDVGAVQATAASPGIANAALSPKEPSLGNAAQIEILDWILSNTTKADATTASPKDSSVSQDALKQMPQSGSEQLPQGSSDGVDPLDSPASVSHAEQLKDRLNDSAEVAKNLDDIFTSSSGPTVSESMPTNWSAEFSVAQEKIQSVSTEELPLEKTVDNEAMHKLQAELDAALIMKEQTEKSLEKLQEELKELTEKRKQDLEQSSKQHEEEIGRLKSQHKEEMEELQKISEETVKQVSKHYTEIWKMFEKEKTDETQSIANSITEKCLELMKQQQETLSQKLEEERISQEKEMKETLEKEREKLEKDIENQLEKGREKLEKELDEKLKETMAEETKKMQELHTATLKEAMEKQQAHFEENLRSALVNEREKFSDALKDAVKDAQLTTEKAAVERQKMEEKRIRTQTMSVKMFLSTALRQLEQQFPDDTEQSHRKEDDT